LLVLCPHSDGSFGSNNGFSTTKDLWQCLMQETLFAVELVEVVHRTILTNMSIERELKTVACGQ